MTDPPTDTTPRFINRELSWLAFNDRVLGEARDATLPLLERLKFVAITGSNLDEFFKVRVGGLQLIRQQGSSKRDPAGMTAAEQLEAIDQRTREMTAEQYGCFLNDLEPRMAEHGIRRLRRDQLNPGQVERIERALDNEISAVLSPMIVEPDADFPLLVDQPLSVCVRLAGSASEPPKVALIPLGRTLGRFVTLQGEAGYEYMLLEDVVMNFADAFFPGEEVLEAVPMRITRNADMGVREDSAADLLAGMLEVLDARKQSGCVRLEVGQGASDELVEFLTRSLEITEGEVYRLPGPLDLSAFFPLALLPGFDKLRDEAWPPLAPPAIDPSVPMFDTIAAGDLLLYHPYESFEPVVRLIEEAAEDPDVLAIKQTLYRTSRNSPIVAALRRAANLGKYVTAIVELKARFDEERNIEWARDLERAGVQVIYGVKGLKTHSKVCIIVRRESHGIQRYAHFGTGNYNESTARLYGDISLMTCNEELGADASQFFNAVTGRSQSLSYRKIEAAPLTLRDKLLEMIDTETQRRKHGQKAHIAAKLNSLVDSKIIKALYAASQAGVKIKLNIRGICCLRPGVTDLSENIEVTSIIDRFLEHARILYFYHGGDERVFISSADWMPRNLDRRVELLVPVEDLQCKRRLIDILDIHSRDNVKAHRLQPDGSYRPVEGRDKPRRSQQELYEQIVRQVKNAEQSRPATFEPHRAQD